MSLPSESAIVCVKDGCEMRLAWGCFINEDVVKWIVKHKKHSSLRLEQRARYFEESRRMTRG